MKFFFCLLVVFLRKEFICCCPGVSLGFLENRLKTKLCVCIHTYVCISSAGGPKPGILLVLCLLVTRFQSQEKLFSNQMCTLQSDMANENFGHVSTLVMLRRWKEFFLGFLLSLSLGTCMCYQLLPDAGQLADDSSVRYEGLDH